MDTVIATRFAKAGSGFVGCGAYGCGVFPAVPCKEAMDSDGDADDDDTKVSKLYKDDTSFAQELKEYKLFQELDPDGTYTVRVVRWCSVPLDKLPARVMAKGPFIDKQLKYEYGGQTLSAMFLDGEPVDIAALTRILMEEVPKMFRFLMLMRDNNVAHGDIHQENITYSPVKGLRLIDFGLAKKLEPFETNHDKFTFGDCLKLVFEVVLDEMRSIGDAKPLRVLMTRIENALLFLRTVYDLVDLEDVQKMWYAATHMPKTMFETKFLKLEMLRAAEAKSVFKHAPEALAEASKIAHDDTSSLVELERFLKKTYFDKRSLESPTFAAVYGSSAKFINDPLQHFQTFYKNLSPS
jgi:hypothetical protein